MENIKDWIVLNCHVTQILGHYDTEAEATKAAKEFGNCSFQYELSEKEKKDMAAAQAA